MLYSPVLAGAGSGSWLKTYAADTANVDIKADLEAIYGAMVGGVPVDAIIIIATGVRIYSTSSSAAAMGTGNGWPSGSKLKIINNGKIRGCGGNGASYSGFYAGVGGDALDIRLNVNIDNTSGEIFGGGGGGGLGGSAPWISARKNGFYTIPPPPPPYDPGDPHSLGPGGGGQGDSGGYGGAGDTGIGGSNGSDGSASAPGTGATGVNSGYAGGRGGYWGEAGQTGAGEPGTGGWTYDGFGHWAHHESGSYGVAGGNPGRAINKHSKSVTWLGGNNGSQVKGAVS